MKLAILSDTHIKNNAEDLEEFLSNIKDVDILIHAGDFSSKLALDILKLHKCFVGVYGNVDDTYVQQELRNKEILEIKGYRIGIVHGHGEKKTTVERAIDSFKDDMVDIIVFGHSHQPLIQTRNKVLLLNPGSPTSKRKEKWYSYILLELREDGLEAKLCFKEKTK